ncbi:nucleoside 2-deoxyribosyltransferase [Ramlibacter sp. MMS24-I3-19]|uniref:nucleoside 2-deoxyribosyltransferase n=1 Tax=Ramlibacter sp. MMS24-I3-19 TaxID=3416606 RepID=UPI003D081445
MQQDCGVAVHRVYLAGPDVFRPDAAEHGRKLVDLCAEWGFEGLFPLDESLGHDHRSPQELAMLIYRENVARIESCDAVLANLDFFRGLEPDSGTCFEVGYAIARGKVVIGYIPQGEASLTASGVGIRASLRPALMPMAGGWRTSACP